MKILFLGDLLGRSGREAVIDQVPMLRKKWDLDCVIVNGENAAHGFGITAKICKELYEAGVDCITTGNHVWDQRELLSYIDRDNKVLRPLNFPENTPGQGASVIQTPAGKILVMNVMGRVYMDAMDDPFAAVNKVLERHQLGRDVKAVVLDIHAEANSEKMAMGHFCDGRVSLVVGTHTHVPTADLQILSGGTAYQTDAGMCGSYDSVIGMDKDVPIMRFTRKFSIDRLRPADGDVTICGLRIETDDATGLCINAEPVRIGGLLRQTA